MRAKEFLKEADIPADFKRMGKAGDNFVSAMRGALSIPGISQNKSNGNPYQGYRFGLAMATADGKGTNRTPPAGAIAGDPLLNVYTDEEYAIIQQAAKDVMAGAVRKLSDLNSIELPEVNKTSPVAKPKTNKYGI